MLHFICALKCEALPIIEHYSLKHDPSSSLFSIYLNTDKDISLTLSGPGKLAANAASLYTFMILDCKATDSWINVGIAGHVSHQPGQLFLSNRVKDSGSLLSWYPQILVKTSIPDESLLTLEQPSIEYCEMMYDMEASGIFHAACRFSTLELIHSIKVISDNQEHPAKQLDKNEVTGLIASRSDDICNFADCVSSLSQELEPKLDYSSDITKLTGQYHFSQYQKSKLKLIMRRWYILFPGTPPESAIQQHTSDAGLILQQLQQAMDSAPFYLDEPGCHD